MLSLFGSIKEIVLPTRAEVEDLVTSVFEGLGVETIEIPFSLESARSSFLKTIEKLPPCDKTQEFKDGVLWADCLNLLQQDNVLLVSQDKAFHLNREYGKGLAENLLEEAAGKPFGISLVSSLADVLNQVEVALTLDETWLLSSILAAHTGVRPLLERSGAEKAGREDIRYSLFATEKPDVVHFAYAVAIPCTDVADLKRTNMRMTLKGDASLHPNTSSLSDIRISEEELSYVRDDGIVDRVTNLYASLNSILFGHRTMVHTVRHPLKVAGSAI